MRQNVAGGRSAGCFGAGRGRWVVLFVFCWTEWRLGDGRPAVCFGARRCAVFVGGIGISLSGTQVIILIIVELNSHKDVRKGCY
jgi:hypothetical protein